MPDILGNPTIDDYATVPDAGPSATVVNAAFPNPSDPAADNAPDAYVLPAGALAVDPNSRRTSADVFREYDALAAKATAKGIVQRLDFVGLGRLFGLYPSKATRGALAAVVANGRHELEALVPQVIAGAVSFAKFEAEAKARESDIAETAGFAHESTETAVLAETAKATGATVAKGTRLALPWAYVAVVVVALVLVLVLGRRLWKAVLG